MRVTALSMQQRPPEARSSIRTVSNTRPMCGNPWSMCVHRIVFFFFFFFSSIKLKIDQRRFLVPTTFIPYHTTPCHSFLNDDYIPENKIDFRERSFRAPPTVHSRSIGAGVPGSALAA
jgi:hypothetical protein